MPIENTQEAIQILKYGQKGASNSRNLNSSQSHDIVCIKIVALEEMNKTATVTQLSFCDLAERRRQTETTGTRVEEASMILPRCIKTMIANQKAGAHKEQMPYVNTKLIRLFQAFFEGRGMVKMVVNIDSSSQRFDESVRVLKLTAAITDQISSVDKSNYEAEQEEEKRRQEEAELAMAAASYELAPPDDLYDDGASKVGLGSGGGKKKALAQQKRKNMKSKLSQRKSAKKLSSSSDLMTKILSTMEKHKEVFFVIRLLEAKQVAQMGAIVDRDPAVRPHERPRRVPQLRQG